MSFSVNQAQLHSAASGNKADMRQMLTAIAMSLSQLHAVTGTAPIVKVDSTPPLKLLPPSQASFSVAGANGVFTVTITAPQSGSKAIKPVNALQTPIYYELSSSPVVDFGSGVVTYPLTTSLNSVFHNPGASLFWRLRSSYDQTTFNQYRAQAGAVSAGLVTSAASNPNLSLNQSNFATVDSLANGASATIRIYGSGGPGTSWTRGVGTASQVIPGGTIANVPYGFNGFVAWDGTRYQLKATLPQTFPDGWFPVGAISVVSSSSGLVLPVVTAVVVSGAIVAYEIPNAGADLGSVELSVSDPTGSGALPVGTIKNGQLIAVIGPAGSSYSSSPTVHVTGSVDAGATGGGGNQGSNGGRLYTVAA